MVGFTHKLYVMPKSRDGRGQASQKEIARGRAILCYTSKIHECVDNIYEYLVDRQYRDFNDEIDAAIEFLQHLKEHRDKKL
jgi:hypothetical protein